MPYENSTEIGSFGKVLYTKETNPVQIILTLENGPLQLISPDQRFGCVSELLLTRGKLCSAIKLSLAEYCGLSVLRLSL